MKISTKGRYALRLMLDIALHGTEKPVRIRDIAKRQGISEKYLEQIVSILNKAELVKSTRGPQGGYQLQRPPEKYPVGEILTLIEGPLVPVACMEDEEISCVRSRHCATLRLWQMLEAAIAKIVDNVTVADLVKWQQEVGEFPLQDE